LRFLFILFSLLAIALVGCVAPSGDYLPSPVNNPAEIYPDLGEAPELTNDVWLNTDEPLRLVDLHGKVVLLDMWTFG
jgi:hypothetical protein